MGLAGFEPATPRCLRILISRVLVGVVWQLSQAELQALLWRVLVFCFKGLSRAGTGESINESWVWRTLGLRGNFEIPVTRAM